MFISKIYPCVAPYLCTDHVFIIRQKEARAINVSLTALGKVVLALSQGTEAGHVPYRDSKLTRILKNSLSGNSYTTLLAMLHPAHDNYEECFNTLQVGKGCDDYYALLHYSSGTCQG